MGNPTMTSPWPCGEELVPKKEGGSSVESKAALQRAPSNTLRNNETLFEDTQRVSRQSKQAVCRDTCELSICAVRVEKP